MVFLGDAQPAWAHETGGGDHPEALERHFEMVQFKDKQRHFGGHEQPDSGGKITGTWLPDDQEPHNHDLPSWRKTEFCSTHMKQRGTEIGGLYKNICLWYSKFNNEPGNLKGGKI